MSLECAISFLCSSPDHVDDSPPGDSTELKAAEEEIPKLLVLRCQQVSKQVPTKFPMNTSIKSHSPVIEITFSFHRETRCGGISGGDGVEGPRRQEVSRSSSPPPSNGRVHNKSRKSMVFCLGLAWKDKNTLMSLVSSSSSSLSLQLICLWSGGAPLRRLGSQVGAWWWVVLKHFPSQSFCILKFPYHSDPDSLIN